MFTVLEVSFISTAREAVRVNHAKLVSLYLTLAS